MIETPSARETLRVREARFASSSLLKRGREVLSQTNSFKLEVTGGGFGPMVRPIVLTLNRFSLDIALMCWEAEEGCLRFGRYRRAFMCLG